MQGIPDALDEGYATKDNYCNGQIKRTTKNVLGQSYAKGNSFQK